MKEIYLTGTIWNGTFDWVKWQIDQMEPGEQLVIWMNSPGGSLLEGVAIYNELLKLNPKPIIKVFGLAGSAASVIACAGTVEIAETAFFFVHNALYEWVDGNADELRKMAEDLDKFSASIIAAYARKTGKPGEELKTLMDAESLLTAQEALDWGFADKIYSMDSATNLKLLKIAAKYTDSISIKLNNVKPTEESNMSEAEMKAQIDAMNARFTSVENALKEKDQVIATKDHEIAEIKASAEASKIEAQKLSAEIAERDRVFAEFKDVTILNEEKSFVASISRKLKADEIDVTINKLVALRKSDLKAGDKTLYELEREQLTNRADIVAEGSIYGLNLQNTAPSLSQNLRDYNKEKR